jgi:hypothetical protein
VGHEQSIKLLRYLYSGDARSNSGRSTCSELSMLRGRSSRFSRFLSTRRDRLGQVKMEGTLDMSIALELSSQRICVSKIYLSSTELDQDSLREEMADGVLFNISLLSGKITQGPSQLVVCDCFIFSQQPWASSCL